MALAIESAPYSVDEKPSTSAEKSAIVLIAVVTTARVPASL
jgi:hypothetical protein